MAITAKYLIVDGVKVCCETNNGPAQKGTIVCLGSAGRDSRQFHGIMDELKEQFEVVAFDMPGHGKSWPLKGNRVISEYHEYGDFIIKVVTELGIINPIYIGCALGGNTVFYIAQRQPVRAIVSMAGGDYTPNVDQSVIDMLNYPYSNVQYSHYDFTESLIGSAASPENKAFILWGVCSECGVVKAADYGGVFNGFDVRAGMRDITCPTLILRGEQDWTAIEDKLKTMMESLISSPKVVYKVLAGLGHYSPQESPLLVAGVISEFISNR